MKKLFFLFIILYLIPGYSQPIKVSPKKYNPEQLVKDVLFNTPCVSIDNITFKGKEGISYFEKGKSKFPMDYGIVLTTSNAITVPGQSTYRENKSRGPELKDPDNKDSGNKDSGDNDLLTYIKSLDIDPNLEKYNNATILEFDFIPLTDKISFRFLFASDEYGKYQCEYADAFAFFLTNTETNKRDNLAIVPNTNNPISVLTIRDSIYNKGEKKCPSVNPEYFNKYNEGNNNSAINFRGETIVMTAESKVKANVKYHIKLVIADRKDYNRPSAVFIEGGSFAIGLPSLGDDLTIDEGTALCPGDTYLLDSKLNPNEYIFQWKKDGENIVGQNNPSLEVKETGKYELFLKNKGEASCIVQPDPILIEFFDDIIIENKPIDLEACNIKGVNSKFNLNSALKNITFSQVEYSFYETKENADKGESELPSMYALEERLNEKEIWVKIKSTKNKCFKTLSFKIKKIDCELKLVDLDDLTSCAEVGIGNIITFNIGQYSKEVYHNAPGYKVTYHTSEEDAKEGTNTIPKNILDKYPGTKGDVIWVRVTKESDPKLFKITSFKLKTINPPKPNDKVTPLKTCLDPSKPNKGIFNLKDKDLEVSFSVSGVNITYYETEADAIKGNYDKSLPSSNYESGDKNKIYARIELIKTGCFSITSFDLELVEFPKLEDIKNINICNSNNTGYAVFDLLPIKSDLVKNPLASSLDISFHSSINDAQLNIKPLGDIYNNVKPWNEDIYIRMSIEGTDCVNIKPLRLIVNRVPDIKQPSDYIICDFEENGIGSFDLTIKEDDIFEGLEKENYNIFYYSTKNDANEGDIKKAIKETTNYSNLNSEYIWIRVSDKTSGCSKIVSMKLVVNPLPDISKNIKSFILCDDIENNGFASFNLNDKIEEITQGKQGLIVEFYITQENAKNKINPIISDTFTNTEAYKQVIFVRVEDSTTGCYIVSPLTLEVASYPILNLTTETTKICTNSDNEVAVFNLLSIVESSLIDFSSYDYFFFETRANAFDNFNKITDPDNYNNLKGKVSVWVRIVNKKTECFSIYELKLETVVAPKIPLDLETIIACDSHNDHFDGLTKIDLTQNNDAILLRQPKDIEEYKIDFYTTLADAESDKNIIIEPKEYINTSPEQTIWIKLTDKTTGCFSIEKFSLKVNIPIKLVKPSEISACNSDINNDSVETFDLTIREKDILGGTNIYGTKFEYYETEEDALNRVNKIKTPESYKNKKVAQSIWIVVENEFGCLSSVVLTIRVLPLPKPIMKPNVLEICESVAGTGVGKFDLSISDLEIRNGDNNLKLTYFEDKQDAIDKINAIKMDNNTLYYDSKSSIIYVRVETTPTNVSDSCFVIVELELKVNPIPVFDVKPFVVCLTEKVEFYEFNLEEKIPEILGKRDKNLFSVKFFIDIKTANSGEDPLPLLYTNVKGDSQTIYVRLEDINTGCFSVKPLVIQIEDIVYVSSTESPKYFCDNNDGDTPINDGFTTIDLTAYNADILGDNNIIPTSELQVLYYASESDFDMNIPIASPSTFVNTSSPQKIIAVVKSKKDKLYCQAQTSFEIIVNKLPEMLHIEGGYICENLETRVISPFIIDTKLDSNLYDFIWEVDNEIIDGANLPYYEANLPGEYTVSIANKKTNCKSVTTTVKVEKINPFTISIDELSGDLDVMSEERKQTITVNVETQSRNTSLRDYEFALDNGEYQSSNIFHDVAPGEHMIWVRDITNRTCAMSKGVSVINHPKYFTPNGDGYNDTWNIKGIKNQPNAKIYIFDRFGKLLKQLDPSGEGWDGTFMGNPMPSTDYWFTVEYKDNEGNQKSYKGHFSLKR